jgi:hypothetical protein
VFLSAFLFVFALHLVILAAAADLVSQGESGKTTAAATASKTTRQYQASQPVFLTAFLFAFLILFAFHLVILAAAADLASQGQGGKTTAAATASQSTRQHQASQPVFLSAFLSAFLFVFVFLAFVFENSVSEREASKLAAPVHAARQKKLGHMTFISLAVQAIS